jgi:hypothetical protein
LVTPDVLVQLLADNVPHDVGIPHDYTTADFQTADHDIRTWTLAAAAP